MATDSGVSAYTWRAVMAWALAMFGDQRNGYAQHQPAQIAHRDDFELQLDGLVFIDRQAGQDAWRSIEAEQIEAARLAAMGYSAADAVRSGDGSTR